MLRNDALKELGKIFGMTGYNSPAGNAVGQVKKKLSEDEKLEHRVELIKDYLLRGSLKNNRAVIRCKCGYR